MARSSVSPARTPRRPGRRSRVGPCRRRAPRPRCACVPGRAGRPRPVPRRASASGSAPAPSPLRLPGGGQRTRVAQSLAGVAPQGVAAAWAAWVPCRRRIGYRRASSRPGAGAGEPGRVAKLSATSMAVRLPVRAGRCVIRAAPRSRPGRPPRMTTGCCWRSQPLVAQVPRPPTQRSRWRLLNAPDCQPASATHRSDDVAQSPAGKPLEAEVVVAVGVPPAARGTSGRLAEREPLGARSRGASVSLTHGARNSQRPQERPGAGRGISSVGCPPTVSSPSRRRRAISVCVRDRRRRGLLQQHLRAAVAGRPRPRARPTFRPSWRGRRRCATRASAAPSATRARSSSRSRSCAATSAITARSPSRRGRASGRT